MNTTAPYMPGYYLSNLLDAFVLTGTFIFTALIIDPEWQNVLIAIGGSFAGAFILAYFRRDPRKAEQFYKILCASICGLVTGAAIQEGFAITGTKISLFVYVLSGLLSLTLLQALYNMTEKNAVQIVGTGVKVCWAAFLRAFNMAPARPLPKVIPAHRKKGRRDRRRGAGDEDMP